VCASLVQSLVFMGLMANDTLHHCVLFICEMVDFITKGHKMGSLVLTWPCHHFNAVVVLRATRVNTLRALSITIGRVGASLLCGSPSVLGLVIYPRIIRGSLCVCTVGIEVFHH
jgi:hypothetical protein